MKTRQEQTIQLHPGHLLYPKRRKLLPWVGFEPMALYTLQASALYQLSLGWKEATANLPLSSSSTAALPVIQKQQKNLADSFDYLADVFD